MSFRTDNESAFYGLAKSGDLAKPEEVLGEMDKFGAENKLADLIPSGDLGDLAEKLKHSEKFERASTADVTAYNQARGKLQAIIDSLEAKGINIEGARDLLSQNPDGLNNQQLSDLAAKADGVYRDAASRELQLTVSGALETIGDGAKVALAWAETSPNILMTLAKVSGALTSKEVLAANKANGAQVPS